MEWFNFILHPESSEEDVLEELSACDLKHPSFLEDFETGLKSLCAAANPSLFSKKWKFVTSYTKIENTEIDWTSEWNTFSPYFQEGLAKIPLSDFDSHSKKEVILLPGPGFGDLSHPTTTLSLKLLAKYASGKTLIDLGCGSGILSIAALQWGSPFVYSLDIDPLAIRHTQENAALNGAQDLIQVSDSLPSPLSNIPSLLVMNMTFEDQKKALKSLSFMPNLWITSGILEEQKEAYLSWTQEMEFYPRESLSKDGWMAWMLEKRG